jgi:hypothetical protein
MILEFHDTYKGESSAIPLERIDLKVELNPSANPKAEEHSADLEEERLSSSHHVTEDIDIEATVDMESSNMLPLKEEIQDEKPFVQDIAVQESELETEEKTAVLFEIDLTIAEPILESKPEPREFIIDLTQDMLPLVAEPILSVKMKKESKPKQKKVTPLHMDLASEFKDTSEDFTSWLSRLSSNIEVPVLDSDQGENTVPAGDVQERSQELVTADPKENQGQDSDLERIDVIEKEDLTSQGQVENSPIMIDPLDPNLEDDEDVEKPRKVNLEPKIQISKDDELINALADPFLTHQKQQKNKRSHVHFSEELSAMDFISETMAILLVKQGNIDKAKEMYIKLIEKFPEKNTYFASQIEKINQ